ncbi:hypothetical protein Tco_0210734 [Tanacetum coccineum]
MVSLEQGECMGCGQPCVGFYCYFCTYQQCGVNLINKNCLNCTYRDGKPVTCCGCEGPLNDGFCSFCASGAGNSFAYDPNPNSYNDSQNFSDHPTHSEPILCDFCGNDARYGHYCTPQVPNPEPCYNQNYDEFPQTLPSFQQQILCCENCGGPHATFECQPMNQNFHETNSSGFDQIQPPQLPVIHQPPQEMRMEILQAKDDLMISIETFLKKFNHISFWETPKVLMQAWDKVFEIKHAPSYNLPTSSYDDDDDEYSFTTQEYLMTCSTTITPDSLKMDSLIMVDKHLDTIPEIELDEFIKSSVENLVQNLSDSEDECECDVPNCDASQTINFSTFSNPLFDDSTSSDDESSHEEVIHKISFKTYFNPLFDLDEEIISSELNPIHNEDLDSTPKNDRFDTESYLLESLLKHDTLMASSPKIDSLFDEFAGELVTIPPRIVNREHEEYVSLLERLLYDNSSPRPPKDFHVNPNTIIESLPTFPILVEDSDSLREEIDIFPGLDDSIPLGIESDDYDSEVNDNSTSLQEFESFHVDYPDSGDSTIDMVEDIPVDVPNILPTHPTLHTDFDFIPSHNDLRSDLDVSSPFGDRNNIYDPGICIEVESTRFLATHSPVIDTLLPFSSENEDKVFNHGVLASKEKSPPSSSHRGFKASKLFHQKSPMLIYGEDIPILDVLFLHFYPP